MIDSFLEMMVPPLPLDLEAKIFHIIDEDGQTYGEAYSFNDSLRKLKDISGVNEEMIGPSK